MTQWWVAVNCPYRLQIGELDVRFDRSTDFAYLWLTGGFVVDVWGALWNVQQHRMPAAARNRGAIGPMKGMTNALAHLYL